MTNQEYDQLKDIKSHVLNDKSVLIIGGGFMGKQYAHALAELNVNDVTIITRGEKQFSDFSIIAVSAFRQIYIINLC